MSDTAFLRCDRLIVNAFALLLFSVSFGSVWAADTGYRVDDPTRFLGIGTSTPTSPIDILRHRTYRTLEGSFLPRSAQNALITTLKSGGRWPLSTPFMHPYASPDGYDFFKLGYHLEMGLDNTFYDNGGHRFESSLGMSVNNQFGHYVIAANHNQGVVYSRNRGRMDTVGTLFLEQLESNSPSSSQRPSRVWRVPMLTMGLLGYSHQTEVFSGRYGEYNEVAVAVGDPGVGIEEDFRPQETLDVYGAIVVGDRERPFDHAGTLIFRDGDFFGYNGSSWISLTGSVDSGDVITGGARNAILGSDQKLVFGKSSATDVADNYLVNSLYSPSGAWGNTHYLFREAGSSVEPLPGRNYITDDETTGGTAVVTNGRPRLSVMQNGNTYIHEGLAVGVDSRVAGTRLTVGGAVHIGPAGVAPIGFHYGGRTDEHLLWVEKGIVSEKYGLAGVDSWSDHVFDADYPLMPLSALADYIGSEGHLPGVPTAEEVKENGYSVHALNRVLLEKIEELTLHAIARQKAIDTRKEAVQKQADQLRSLQADMVGQARELASIAARHSDDNAAILAGDLR